MLSNRTRSSLLVGLLVLWAVLPALGEDFREVQLWAPAEVGPYGSGPQPAEGFFFNFDQVYWNISRPATQTIGQPAVAGEPVPSRQVWFGTDSDVANQYVQTNSHDTSMLRSSDLSGSQRFDVGRVIDRWGWFVSTYNLHAQNQTVEMNNVSVVFEDPPYGAANRRFLQGYYIDFVSLDPEFWIRSGLLDLPVIFDTMTVTNRTEHWNVELNMLYRTRQLHRGGFLEFFAGARYLEFSDQFKVEGFGQKFELDEDSDIPQTDAEASRGRVAGNAAPWFLDIDDWASVEPYNSKGVLNLSALGDSIWDTQAENNVIGPQIGVRWFRQHGRWRLSGEGRFFAGINNQSITQTGVLGSDLDPNLGVTGLPYAVSPQTFHHRASTVEFSPAFEIRFNTHYQFTRAISLKAGWTGFWIDSIARPSGMVNYLVNASNAPSMGIDMTNNRQSVFVHGFNIGVEVNR